MNAAAPGLDLPEMPPEVFEGFRRLVYDRSGIAIAPGKEALVRSRVSRRMRALGIGDYRAYLDRVSRDGAGDEVVLLLDAISTNVTSFLREARHFEILAGEVKRWLADGRSGIRLWSAACSTGEEPYTISMAAREAAGGRGTMDVRVLATDLSTAVLARAREGMYEAARVEPLPLAWRDRWFERRDGRFIAGPDLRKDVSFARLNLSQPPFPMKGPFDAVFCRNVMIYFDAAVRTRLIAEIARLLRPGGILFVGHAESLAGIPTELKVREASVYVKP